MSSDDNIDGVSGASDADSHDSHCEKKIMRPLRGQLKFKNKSVKKAKKAKKEKKRKDSDSDSDSYIFSNKDTDADTDADTDMKDKPIKKLSKEIIHSDICETKKNEHFVQPIKKVGLSTDYISMCDDVLKNLAHIQRKEESYGELIEEMKNSMNMIKKKLHQIKSIGRCFNKRDIMISAFALTSNNIIKSCPSTRGDYDRKYLECPRALEDLFEDDIYGNPMGTDINFVFDDSNITQIVIYMDKLRQMTDKPVSERFMFGVFRLDKIYKNDVIIRTEKNKTQIRYTMIMTDTESKPEKSIRCHIINASNEANVRVQNIDLCGDDVFESTQDLVLRRVVHAENITKFIMKLTEEMPRDIRIMIWESILGVIEKDILFLNQGYRYVDIGDNKMIKISFEEKTPCEITAQDPPYIYIHLACDHKFSLMAIYGIVYEGKSEDTESIVCPLCRRNLIPKLVPVLSEEEKESFKIKIYEEKDIKSDVDLGEFTFEKQDKILDNIAIDRHHLSDKYIDEMFERRKKGHKHNDDDDESYRSNASINSEYFMNWIGERLFNH
jgi:hypothetical protein